MYSITTFVKYQKRESLHRDESVRKSVSEYRRRRHHNPEVIEYDVPDPLLAPAVNVVRADKETDVNCR